MRELTQDIPTRSYGELLALHQGGDGVKIIYPLRVVLLILGGDVLHSRSDVCTRELNFIGVLILLISVLRCLREDG